MQSQKVLGIPLLTLVIIIIAFCGITYYASSYASENSLILEKYQAARAQLITSQRTHDKLDKTYKICISNLNANEESNRELTIKIKKIESLQKAQENKNNECQSQVSSLHQFYLKMREHVGLMKDNDQMNTGDVTQAEIEEVTQTLKDKQAKDLKDEKEKCEKMIQTKLESADKSIAEKAHELEQLQAKNNELKEEVANVRKLLDEKDNELSHHLREIQRPGFQQKQTKEENPNVKMIDLNKEVEGDKKENVAKSTEPSKKEVVSEKTEAPTPTTIPTINTTVQLKQTKSQTNQDSSEGAEINQNVEVTESGNATKADKVTTQPKPQSTEITKNDIEVEKGVDEGEIDKRTETDEDADFDDHFDNDTH